MIKDQTNMSLDNDEASVRFEILSISDMSGPDNNYKKNLSRT